MSKNIAPFAEKNLTRLVAWIGYAKLIIIRTTSSQSFNCTQKVQGYLVGLMLTLATGQLSPILANVWPT